MTLPRIVSIVLLGAGLPLTARAQAPGEQLLQAAEQSPTSPAEVWAHLQIALLDIWSQFVNHLPLVLAAVVVLFVTWGASRIVDRLQDQIFERLKLRSSLEQLVARLLGIAIWIAGSMLAAMIVFPGLTPSRALAVLGAGSVAIGFAFKDIFENFLAGVLILAGDAFQPGDLVHCVDIEGRIESVSVRNTSIRTLDGQLVVVPNAMLFKNPVVVRTDKDVRRLTIVVGVGYGEDVARCASLIEETVRSLDSVHTSQPVQIFARGFGASSIDFEVTWWTGSPQIEIRQSRHEVIEAIKRRLDEEGVEIPFPHRTLTFNDPVPVRTSEDGSAESA